MALMKCNFFSQTLGKCSSMYVVLPQKSTEGQIGVDNKCQDEKYNFGDFCSGFNFINCKSCINSREIIIMDAVTYENVKELRIQKGLSQKAFSEYFEIPVRTVSDWERGLRKPPEWVCKLLIKGLCDFS